MDDKIRIFGFLLAAFAVTALAFMGFGGWLGYQRGYDRAKGECRSVKSDTVYKTDTVVLDIFKTDTVVRIERVPFRVPVHDTVVDSVLVSLPMEWHHTHVEDTADVWYHGVMAGIDSMRFFVPSAYITQRVIETEYKMPLITLDLGAGAMYHDRRINPYLVMETRYNARKTAFGAYGTIDNEGRWSAGINAMYRIDILKN